MKKLSSFLLVILFFSIELIAVEKRPYHHLPDGTFRNPEGSPERTSNMNIMMLENQVFCFQSNRMKWIT